MSDITDFLSSLKGDEVGVVLTPPGGGDQIAAIKITFEELCHYTTDDERLFVMSMTIRPGWSYFVRHLELIHFPPMSEKNDSLIIFHFMWHDMPFTMVSVPKEFRSDIEDSAKVTQMRMVETGLPMTPTKEGWDRMPFDAKNVITLESERYSVLHKLGNAAARQWEQEEIQKLEQSVGL